MMLPQEDLARIMTAEAGQATSRALVEVAYAASFIEWFGRRAKAVYGRNHPRSPAGQNGLSCQKEPGPAGPRSHYAM